MSGSASSASAADREILITRVLHAPQLRVWQAWTEPQRIEQWWGPRGFSTKVTELDLRPGGRWRYVMVAADGTEYPSKGVFREVTPRSRIVTTDEFDEAAEYPTTALPCGIIVTCAFDDLGDRTGLAMRIVHATVEDRRKHEAMGVVVGWDSMLDCLEDYLAANGAD